MRIPGEQEWIFDPFGRLAAMVELEVSSKRFSSDGLGNVYLHS
jgi:hypothetical protein